LALKVITSVEKVGGQFWLKYFSHFIMKMNRPLPAKKWGESKKSTNPNVESTPWYDKMGKN
jgi:hypothetical protein